MKKPRIQRAKLLGEAQSLIGAAINDFRNDRDPNHLDKGFPKLERAFEILLKLRERYKAT
jgi:hypothetical protein